MKALRTVAATAALLELLSFAAQAQSAQLGGRLFTGDGVDLSATIQPGNPAALYVNLLYESSPDRISIGTNAQSGLAVQLGNLDTSGPLGEELVFALFDDLGGHPGTGYTYFTGPGPRNPDGLAHALVEWTSARSARVGFEDLFQLGDQSFNDTVFVVEGVTPGVDLQSVAIRSSTRGVVGSPIPVNATTLLELEVRNCGFADLEWPFEVGFYISTDADIDPGVDHQVGLARHGGPLAAGESVVLAAESFGAGGALRLEPTCHALPAIYHGRVWLGAVIDPLGAVAEIERDNNGNVGAGIDRVEVQLYDPVHPYVTYAGGPSGGRFASRADAVRHLESALGFTFADGTLFVDPGWSRNVSGGPVRSRFDGAVRPAAAFRLHGTVVLLGGAWVIRIQGADATLNPGGACYLIGEPRPVWAAFDPASTWEWFRYVNDYHTRF